MKYWVQWGDIFASLSERENPSGTNGGAVKQVAPEQTRQRWHVPFNGWTGLRLDQYDV
jgi:hypothetical protein